MSELYLQLRITAVIRETPDTFTYQLEPVNGEMISYQAGQFLTFVVQLHGTEYRRSYSCSSTPGIDKQLAITVREKENGEISRHILRHWHVGQEVTALQPSGRFTLSALTNVPRDIFLIGAGSGITPLFSLLKHILHNEPTAHVTLLYSVPSHERTIFYHQLQALQQQFPAQLDIHYLFSVEPLDDRTLPRRLSNSLLENIVKEHLKYAPSLAQFFICGPPEYMRMGLLTLRFMGFDDAQLHKENFVVNTAPQLARVGVPDDAGIKDVTLRFHEREYTLKVPGNRNLLGEALAQGIALPYSCRGGVCGSCTARCLEGNVKMTWNEVLTDKEIADGYFLTCTGYIVSPQVSIEI
jgi:ring-1,2-phenylacetyl-CoA epoxidase subunit PaaE